MKKSIIRRLGLILFLAITFSLIINFFVQFHASLRDELEESQQIFREMRQILDNNEEESALVEKDFSQICLVRAKAAAYIVQHMPEVVADVAELNEIARFLLIDEIHIFNPEGTIYAGTTPEYFGMSFHFGEQMQFFLPMLKDKTLELCQETTPNTTESSLMQYAAVWCEDGKNIVQIGMKPERVMEAKNKTELPYIFSLVTAQPHTDIYAIDADTLDILASTRNDLEDRNALKLGFRKDTLFTPDKVFMETINRTNSICVFDQRDNIILAIVNKSSPLFLHLLKDTLVLAIYVTILASIALFFIVRYLNDNIICGIHDMNDSLMKIGKGNQMIKLPPQPTPEMTELSSHINSMVTSLMNQQIQLSLILETVKLPLGIYEYNIDNKQLNITSRAKEILDLSNPMLNDECKAQLFCRKIEKILHSPVDKESNIYLIPGNIEKFVRVEYLRNESDFLGLIIDVTKDFQEKQNIEHERDVDLLTNLLTRRAFYRHMEDLFQHPEELGCAAFVMIDSDNLKFVNDTYGHVCGDLYLQAISQILEKFPARKLAARLSGDEFILLLYGYNSRQELETLISQFYRYRENTYLSIRDEQVPVNFSAGCAFYPEDGKDHTCLMKMADKNMYIDKKARKGIL